MWTYYLRLGLINLRRNPVLTGLMVVTLAVGVAASMASLTLLHAMSGNPIPHKSDRLVLPLLDNFADGDRSDGQAPTQMSYRDVDQLLKARPAARQTAVYGLSPSIDPGRSDLAPFLTEGLAVNADFFSMFDLPFLSGSSWSAEEDERGARVAVIAKRLAERLFEDTAAVGRTLRIGVNEFSIVGVVDDWEPLPKYYRLVGSNSFASHEDVFLPFRAALALEMDANGSVNCSSNANIEPGFAGLMGSECVWMQYWAELESPQARGAFDDFLTAYVAEQRRLGRFPRNADDVVRSFDVMQWLEERGVVGDDSRLQTWLAFGFLLVCLVNTVGLLLAKFSARAAEIGVRRALGAPRIELFKQYLTESAVVGLAGGIAGLGLTLAALWLLAQRSDAMANLARMDVAMLVTTLTLSLLAAILAGLLPTWRACQVVPAVQLKSQ